MQLMVSPVRPRPSKGEPPFFDLYRKPSLEISVFSGRDIRFSSRGKDGIFANLSTVLTSSPQKPQNSPQKALRKLQNAWPNAFGDGLAVFGKQHIGRLKHRHEPLARQKPRQNRQFGQPIGAGKHGHAHQHLAVSRAAMNLRHGGFARDVVACGLKARLGNVHKGQLALCVAALQKIDLSHAQRALAVVVQREFGRGSGSCGLHWNVG
jgi:hypothetical protein